LVGFFGLVPHPFQAGGVELTAFGSTTWRVAPQHRSRSLAALSKLLVEAKDSVLFVTTKNDALGKILDALKFTAFPRPPVFLEHPRSVFVLRLDHVLSYFARGSKLASLGLKAPALAFGTFAAAEWLRMFAAGRLSVKCLTHADARFDELWSRTRGRFANTNVRSAQFLNWHCFTNPEFGKLLFGAYEGERLVGFAVVCLKEPRGVKVYEILDLWCDPEAPQATTSLIGRIIEHGFRNGVDALELPHYSEELLRFSRKYGFLPRKTEKRGEYCLPKKGLFGPDPVERSYLCLMQGDICL